MKITKGTIVRTVMLIIVLINMILKVLGKNILNVDEGTVSYYIETVLEIAVIAAGFWKNNSYSKKAIEADKFLENLRNSEEN